MALFSADGKSIHIRETTAILSIYLVIPPKAYKSFEHAWGKKKATLVQHCKTRLSTLETVAAFLQIKNPHTKVVADAFLSAWTDIMKKKGGTAVRDLLESKNSPPETEGWLRLALFGKDIKDPVESNEEITVMLLTYLASTHARIEAINFAWGIGADTREPLFKTALATTFRMSTSTHSNRFTIPEALVPGPVSLHSTLKEPSALQSNPNAVEACDSADEDALNPSSSSQSNPNAVECYENNGDREIFSRVSHLKESETRAHRVLYDLADSSRYRE